MQIKWGIVAIVENEIVHFVGFEDELEDNDIMIHIEQDLLDEGHISADEEYTLRMATENEIADYQAIMDQE